MLRNPLRSFLENKNIMTSNVLPFVHSTYSFNLDRIGATREISTVDNCKYFNEKIIYLFVGRPAYKWDIEDESPFWTLPTVFIWKRLPAEAVKRIYPFDSGAFKSKRFPQYLTMIPMDEFELGPNVTDIDKVISTFFGTKERYFKGNRGSQDLLESQNLVTVKDVAARGLGELYSEKINDRFDDRSRAIEIQLAPPLSIQKNDVLAIVCPREYSRDVEYTALLEGMAERVEHYDILPYSAKSYYMQIHSIVARIYKDAGLIDG